MEPSLDIINPCKEEGHFTMVALMKVIISIGSDLHSPHYIDARPPDDSRYCWYVLLLLGLAATAATLFQSTKRPSTKKP